LGDLRAHRAGTFWAGRHVMGEINIERLEKTYASRGGRVSALARVDLTIRHDEFITPVGSTGCARQTLFELIGAVIRLSGGLLLHDGVALTRPPRDGGIVLQEAVLLQRRSVLDKKSFTSLVLQRGVGCLERQKLFVALWRVR
jgi:ABC-type taurine transport system ATPase subunit